jgi:hypothetical protein
MNYSSYSDQMVDFCRFVFPSSYSTRSVPAAPGYKDMGVTSIDYPNQTTEPLRKQRSGGMIICEQRLLF